MFSISSGNNPQVFKMLELNSNSNKLKSLLKNLRNNVRDQKPKTRQNGNSYKFLNSLALFLRSHLYTSRCSLSEPVNGVSRALPTKSTTHRVILSIAFLYWIFHNFHCQFDRLFAQLPFLSPSWICPWYGLLQLSVSPRATWRFDE